jgi:hypothetical protein
MSRNSGSNSSRSKSGASSSQAWIRRVATDAALCACSSLVKTPEQQEPKHNDRHACRKHQLRNLQAKHQASSSHVLGENDKVRYSDAMRFGVEV